MTDSDHGPVTPEYVEMLNRVGRAVDLAFNPDLKNKTIGFVLLMFPFEEPAGRMNYLSNGVRGDVLVALKELVNKMETDEQFQPQSMK